MDPLYTMVKRYTAHVANDVNLHSHPRDKVVTGRAISERDGQLHAFRAAVTRRLVKTNHLSSVRHLRPAAVPAIVRRRREQMRLMR